MTRSLMVAIMRNEAPYILEWVAHHRAVGFTDFLIFTNDCTDGTDRILDRLMDLNLVIHCPNPKSAFPHKLKVWQVSALRYASTFSRFRQSDWVATIDADEFIEIRTGDGTLSALTEATGLFDVFSFPVVGYCSDGNPSIGNGEVQSRFRRPRSDLRPDGSWSPQGMAVKSLQRPGIEGAHFRNHRPKIDRFSKRQLTWLDGSGMALPPEFTDHKVNAWTFTAPPGLAHVNHHSLRARNSFALKALRGDAVTESRLGVGTQEQIRNALGYWKVRNQSQLPERTVRSMPQAQKTLADFHADPILNELHEAACSYHETSFARLLQTKAGYELISGLKLQS
ncbi:MAG: glycosyltransferase family 2 protein [Paracoccus sp. (in: a-proteobacteria)]